MGKNVKVERIRNEYMEHERGRVFERREASERKGESERRGVSERREASERRNISEEEEYQEVEERRRSCRHRFIYENIMKSVTLYVSFKII